MQVLFSTQEYVNSHGRAPKGRGGWAFSPLEVDHSKTISPDLVQGEPIFPGDCGAPPSMTLTEARVWISDRYPEVTYWEVCP